jgi:predicted membrane protein
MSNNIDPINRTPQNKVLAGVILLAVGVVLLIKQLNFFFFPDWLISWPMLFIVIGLYIGAKHNFRKAIWFVFVVIGFCNLLDDIFPSFDVSAVVWPVLLISFGLWIIMRKKGENRSATNADYWDKKYQASAFTADKAAGDYTEAEYTTGAVPPPVDPISGQPYASSYDDHLDATAVFGGVNRTILSKNFKGGEITTVFGGTEIDFTNADIQGRVIIDITQVFGGTKIIVPANWHVMPDLSAVFAGVDDKRIKHATALNHDKVLVLKGVSIFAGIEIRSY